ncbi:hypothetical protein ET445_06750 [Agromyces protaetiae]|uniref:Lipoprotein n=1 Tax=Agromyces protaetiae TaxID=2509455 RepID=A0A4V0YH11_9MICO|nr:hypothetical protein [Agromyces protaetiae]QAY73091.1 hypothetical protein ET445_06750 [Agromyces protaetiae]
MSQVTFRRAGLAAVALASVFVLSACAPGKTPVEHFAGLPPASEDADAPETPGTDQAAPIAQWLEQGGKIAVTTFGSSTCPAYGTGIEVVEPRGVGNTIEMSVRKWDGVCTMDLVPHTTVFWTPMNIATYEDLTVLVEGQEVTVPAK